MKHHFQLLSVVVALFATSAAISAQKMPTKGVRNATVVNNSGKTVTISAANAAKNFSMNGGTVVVSGANCLVKIAGYADQVIVSGANSMVHVERVGAVKVTAANAMVSYIGGPRPGVMPAVSNNGVNAIVKQGEFD